MSEVNLVLIKQRRKEMRIPLQEMAETLGLRNASSYMKYENGTYKFKAEQLPIVSNKLRLKMNEIFFVNNIAKIAK